MELQNLSLVAFIQKNQIRTETGDILDFKKYRFMYDVYTDRSALLCCMKSAQIGFTTYEILKTAHEANYEGIDMVYVLPTSDDIKRFSGGKTNKIIAQNPILQKWVKDKDSIEQKQFGGSTIYYQGANSPTAALSFTAKKLVVDEYDRCNQQIVEMYDSRLQSTPNPKRAFFSNPSLPDFGIDRIYKLSDQKKWHVTHSCGSQFIMDESCVNYEEELYQCPSCKGEITDEDRRLGEWKATSEGEWSGYWIPLWIAPWMSAKNICKMKREKTPEFFSNFVAGEPYVGGGNILTQAILEANLTSEVNNQEGRVIIGVDTGHNIYYTLMNKQGVFFHGYCDSVEEHRAKPNPDPNYDPYDKLEKLLKDYPKSIMMADQGGDLIGIRKLQAKYPTRVWLVHSVKETRTQQLIRWGEDKEMGNVLIDRNRMMQVLVDEINDKRLPINGTLEDWQPWFNHWLNIYRAKEIVDESEPSYGWRWVWKRKGADHWALSALYARVGMDRFRDAAATIVGADPFAAVQTSIMDSGFTGNAVRNTMQDNTTFVYE